MRSDYILGMYLRASQYSCNKTTSKLSEELLMLYIYS